MRWLKSRSVVSTLWATLYEGPFPNPRHQPMRVLRLPKWALIWAQGLYIESQPTSPKAYVAGDMAAFWMERNRP
jgi:hypothetical protein